MDKVVKYRDYIQTLLSNYASNDVSDSEVEVQLIFDAQRDHYQWMNVGWRQFNRIYQCVMHFDIKDGKIWLQQNLTEENPAEELVAMGVPKEDIVLGLLESSQTHNALGFPPQSVGKRDAEVFLELIAEWEKRLKLRALRWLSGNLESCLSCTWCGGEVANTEVIAYFNPSYRYLRLNCCAKTAIALPLSQALIPPPTNPLTRI